MPRIVVTCGACNRKHATSAVEKPFICSDCRRSGVEERQAPLLLSRRLEHAPLGFKRARPDEFDSESNDSPDDARIEVSHYAASVVQKRDSEEDARSEASDDWKCTQLCDKDDVGHNIGTDDPESRTCTSDGVVDNGDAGSDNDLDDRPLIQLAINSSRRPVADTASSTAAIVAPPPSMSEADLDSDSGDLVEDDCALRSLDNAKLRDTTVCLICGSSLLAIQNLKGRLHHMKRCSKKSGVSAKDIRWDDDHEMFVNASASARQSPSKDMIRNPYAKHSLSAPASVAAGRQSVSVLSVANVLMEGARLAAKRKKAEAKNAAVATAAKRPGRRSWWQVRDQQPKRACPWYKIIQNTDFCVDGFNYIANTQNFFLSHFHSDHYGGITSSWDAGTIYCSLVTANLVSQQLGVNRKFLHPIPLLTPIVIESRGKPVTVTAIDANHCPGAVMFLFQVGTRNVLHVGDFRWNRSIMQKYSQLNPFFSGQSSLDCIYLDTTYCDEKYALPTQDEAIREAIVVALREFDLACRSKQSLLMLFGAYTIGKERIYMAVAEHLKVQVYVDRRRYRILGQLGWTEKQMSLLTTKPDDSILWVVPLGHINMKQLPNYLQVQIGAFRKSFDRVVGFRPTGWSHSSSKKAGAASGSSSIISTTTRGKFTVHGVPYSEHSSFPELLDCLRCLKPKRIVPTVSVSKSQQQVDLLLRNLS